MSTPARTMIGEPFEAIVGERIEFNANGSGGGYEVIPVSIDLTGNTIFFDYSPGGSGSFSSNSFNGYVFIDKNDTINDIINVTILQQDTTLGVDAERISFNKNQIFINVASLHFTSSDTMKLIVEFAEGNSTNNGFYWPIFLPAIMNGK